MNITRRLSDGLVQYKITDTYELTDKHYKSGRIYALDISNTTHEVVEDVTLPLDFRAGYFTYNKGVWGILNQTIYDEIISTELAEEKTKATLKFETDTDALIKEVVGERSNEYEIAEKEATAFKLAGYPSAEVPQSISSDAIANSRTNTESCDLILEMAVNWRTLQISLRANRLLAKAQVKNAILISEISTIKTAWNKFLTGLDSQMR